MKHKIKDKLLKLDGIQNVITVLNRKQKDKWVNIVAIPDLLSKQEAEDLYTADRTARKTLDKVPKEGVKKWIDDYNTDFPHQSLGNKTPAQMMNLTQSKEVTMA